MAKRKAKVRPRSKKKKKQPSSFLASVKRLFVWAFVVFVCFIGLLFLYTYLYPEGRKEGSKPSVKTETTASRRPVTTSSDGSKKSSKRRRAEKQKPDGSPTPSGSKTSSSSSSAGPTFRLPADVEIPRLQTARTEQIIRHEGYTVSYNSDYRVANWVAYELTRQEAKSKKTERSNKFVPDPAVKGASATNEDYTRTGYDRGHLAPAGDMKWSAKAMRESFYLSNISPQKPGLNRGIWKELEEQSRLWAKENGAVYIVTGPVLTPALKRMGKNRVGVPRTFYKVIAIRAGDRMEAIGFLFENRDYGKTPLPSLAISVDSVEKVTGIDFFPSLPDSTERRMEATVNKEAWSF